MQSRRLLTVGRPFIPQLLICVAPLMVLPFFVQEGYVIFVFTTAFVQATYAMAWNLLARSGQVSLGHAGFFGIGAYASVLMAVNWGVSPWLTVLIGPMIAGLIGVGVGLLCVRLREWFLAMVTFGFALIVESLVVDQLASITHGWDGILVPSFIPSSFSLRNESLYYVAFAAMITIYLITRRMFNSKFGLALSAVHDNQLVASASGVSLIKYKLMAFVASAYLAGLAGAFEAHSVGRFLSPEVFQSLNSFWPLVYSVSGGIGTPEGPVFGAILIRLFWEWLRGMGGYGSMIVIGLVLILEVIFLPRGLVPLLRRFIGTISSK